jgi:hypothetical protein
MRLATLYRFLAQAANANQSAGRIPSDCKAILTALRINFRKAGANYSPLQQNHSNRTINCPFKSSGDNRPQTNRFIRQASR